MPFTVLISVYYREKAENLRESLESVFNQTLPPDEVVLVEDGPLTPALDAVVDSFARRHREMKVVKDPINQGLDAALNNGLRHCSHDLIARMDSDDISMPDRFEKQVAYMEAHPETDVVSAWIDEFTTDTAHIISTRKVPETHDEVYAFGQKRNPINHPVSMYRRNAVARLGGYYHFPLFEDYYLWVRMLMDGCHFHNLQEPLLYFRRTSDLYRRRGGWGYAWVEMKFQLTLHDMGYISLGRMAGNLLVRSTVRVMPNHLRGWFYTLFLRKKKRNQHK